MKTTNHMYLFTIPILLIFTINIQNIYTFKYQPTCHKGIMHLFKWCEQSDCKHNCTCLSAQHVCKQICNDNYCSLQFCSSPKTCYQSVLVNENARQPKIDKMISHSPITQQDCSQGNCKLMRAIKYKNQYTRTFQSCSEGHCNELHSTGDQVKQFCGNCNKMICTGDTSKNCTQLCILGKCKEIICTSKNCKQLCSHESTCNMTCSSNTDICEQKCSHGSTCIMNCYAKQCLQTCTKGTNCTINKYVPTTTVITSTQKATTSTTLSKETATITESPSTSTTTTIKTTIKKLNFIDETNNNVIDNENTKDLKSTEITEINNDIEIIKNARISSSLLLSSSWLINLVVLFFITLLL